MSENNKNLPSLRIMHPSKDKKNDAVAALWFQGRVTGDKPYTALSGIVKEDVIFPAGTRLFAMVTRDSALDKELSAEFKGKVAKDFEDFMESRKKD